MPRKTQLQVKRDAITQRLAEVNGEIEDIEAHFLVSLRSRDVTLWRHADVTLAIGANVHTLCWECDRWTTR